MQCWHPAKWLRSVSATQEMSWPPRSMTSTTISPWQPKRWRQGLTSLVKLSIFHGSFHQLISVRSIFFEFCVQRLQEHEADPLEILRLICVSISHSVFVSLSHWTFHSAIKDMSGLLRPLEAGPLLAGVYCTWALCTYIHDPPFFFEALLYSCLSQLDRRSLSCQAAINILPVCLFNPSTIYYIILLWILLSSFSFLHISISILPAMFTTWTLLYSTATCITMSLWLWVTSYISFLRITAIREVAPGVPVHFHTHSTSSVSLATCFEMARHKCDIIDCCTASMAGNFGFSVT